MYGAVVPKNHPSVHAEVAKENKKYNCRILNNTLATYIRYGIIGYLTCWD